MFYYISFLRPPPVYASLSDLLLVTPQISNDLRTEYLDKADIYYTWLGPGTVTRPAKLTSWRAGTAYKEIPVPSPPQAGQWRLILTCGPTHDDRLIVLGDPDIIGCAPFAVMSMPVTFVRNNKNVPRAVKQEQISRSYAIRITPPIVFDITEQTSFDLDKKIWDSGIGLSSWLISLFTGAATKQDGGSDLCGLRESLFGTSGTRRILELGAGTGIVAITLAILRSTLQDLSNDSRGSIVTTDLPSAMPILQANIATNLSLISEHAPPPQAVILDWEQDPLPPPVRSQLDAGLDVIAMADVTYNTASFDALIGTLSRLVQFSKHRPKVLLGYKERHPDERSLWSRAGKIGLDFRQVAQVSGAGGAPVEIWLA